MENLTKGNQATTREKNMFGISKRKKRHSFNKKLCYHMAENGRKSRNGRPALNRKRKQYDTNRVQINAATFFLGVFPFGPVPALNRALLFGRGVIDGAERLLGRGLRFGAISGAGAGTAEPFVFGVESTTESREEV